MGLIDRYFDWLMRQHGLIAFPLLIWTLVIPGLIFSVAVVAVPVVLVLWVAGCLR